MTLNVLIIGASRGIGLEWAKQFSAQNVNLFLTCRKTNENLEKFSSSATIIPDIDVGSDACIEKIKNCEKLPSKLDVCIFNSGVLNRETGKIYDGQENFSSEEIIRQFNVNSVGPLRAIRALATGNEAAKLQSGSKFFILSSRMGSISDASGGMYGYRMSKPAANMAGKALSNDLKENGIAVGILHPGYVRTDMTGNQGLIDVDESVSGMMKLVENLNMENSGTFWHTNGEVLEW